jgi:hypothetical protein
MLAFNTNLQSPMIQYILEENMQKTSQFQVNIPDYYGKYPIYYIIENNRKQFYGPEYIPSNRNGSISTLYPDILQVCLNNSDYSGLELLLSNGFNPYATNPVGPEIDNYPLLYSLQDINALTIFHKYIEIDKYYLSYENYYRGITFNCFGKTSNNCFNLIFSLSHFVLSLRS